VNHTYTVPTTRDDTLERTGRMVALLATLAYAALIVLVSLVPAEVDASPAHLSVQFDRFLDSFLQSPRTMHNLRDLATNFILYVPLGVLLPWTFRSPASRLTGVFAGVALSTVLEIAQAWTNRFPSAWDIAMNGAGHATAYVLVTTAIARGELSAALFVGGRAGTPRRRLASGLRLILVGLTFLLALLPYDISVSATDVFAKLHGTVPDGGRIFIDPLAPWDMSRASSLVTAVLIFVPFGFLSALAGTPRQRWLRVAMIGALVSAGVEGAQIAVLSRTSDIMQVIFAGIGAALGLGIGHAWDRTDARVDAAGGRAAGHDGALSDTWLVATLLYALFLWAVSWRPFVFVPSIRDAVKRLVFETYWLPLHAYVEQERSLEIWRDLARESALWAPLGVLLHVLLAGTVWPRGVPRVVVAAAIALAWGSFCELGQSLIVNRVSDTTDIMNHLLGAFAGYLLASALRPGTGER
jgi:glycopeptide antibiotics resistance protein